MKGIILAGGRGTRMYPSSAVINKQLLPVYDKPMIYYPLSIMIMAGIRDILIISGFRDLVKFRELLGNGKGIGIRIRYLVEEKPGGIGQAFLIGEEFIGKEPVCLILGDNIFYGKNLAQIMKRTGQHQEGALIFGCWVQNPDRFGVVEFDANGRVLGIEEKPLKPRSHYAVPGLYFYDAQVVQVAKKIKPSARGELEITDLNKEYLNQGKLQLEVLSQDIAWVDTGTPDSLLEAANLIAMVEKKQKSKIGCIEEAVYKMGFIDKQQLARLVDQLPAGAYAQYLRSLSKRGR